MNLVGTLLEKNVVSVSDVPDFLVDSIQYETVMGSTAYGAAKESSDLDVYGFAIPPKSILFPHTAGHIPNFKNETAPCFEQWQIHHIKVDNNEYDFCIYNIVKYFNLITENNPNMIDSLFTKDSDVITITNVSKMLRDKRCIFLHKGSYHKFKGYAYSQLSKLHTKDSVSEKRRATVQKFGYDTKYAYHLIRLLLEVQQILEEQDLDLSKNGELLLQIKNGEWTLEQVEKYFEKNQQSLENLYHTSTLRHSPDIPKVKNLLLECLEEYYGDLSDCITINRK